MRWFTHFVRSSIGSKMAMALTGIGLLGFVVAHMLGNLQVFLGPDSINGYAKSLRLMGPLLWVARGGLIAIVLIHIYAALRITITNRRARPERYRYNDHLTTGYAARTMPMSGLIILAFVLFHLAHYTFLIVNAEYATYEDLLGRHDVYRMVVTGFQSWPIVIFYVAAVGLLSMHLGHGVPSFFQTLGLRHPKYTPLLDKLGPVISGALFLGFAAVPIGVKAGWLTL